MNSYTVDSRLGAVRGGQRPEPPSAQSFIVVLCAVLCSPGVGTGAQPHCEISLHASQGLAHGKAPQLSQPPSQRPAQLSLWLWGQGGVRGALLRTQSLCIWQPNLQHVAARAGFVDKAKCGMASLYLSTPKGQTVAFTLCTNAASAFATPVCNLLVSRTFYDDYDFCLLTDSFYLEVILFSYG